MRYFIDLRLGWPHLTAVSPELLFEVRRGLKGENADHTDKSLALSPIRLSKHSMLLVLKIRVTPLLAKRPILEITCVVRRLCVSLA